MLPLFKTNLHLKDLEILFEIIVTIIRLKKIIVPNPHIIFILQLYIIVLNDTNFFLSQDNNLYLLCIVSLPYWKLMVHSKSYQMDVKNLLLGSCNKLCVKILYVRRNIWQTDGYTLFLYIDFPGRYTIA